MVRGLIAKEVGDTVTITTPGGKREVEIVSVDFLDIGPPDDITSNTR